MAGLGTARARRRRRSSRHLLCTTVRVRAEYLRDDHAGTWALLGRQDRVRAGVVARSERCLRASIIFAISRSSTGTWTTRSTDARRHCSSIRPWQPHAIILRSRLPLPGAWTSRARSFSTLATGRAASITPPSPISRPATNGTRSRPSMRRARQDPHSMSRENVRNKSVPDSRSPLQPNAAPTALDNRNLMATITASSDIVPFPASPQSVEEAGIPLDLILQLALKSLHFAGELSGTELCSPARPAIFMSFEPALDLLKSSSRFRVVGGGFVGGASYRYRITDSGRDAGRALPRDQPLRRRRTGSAGAVPGTTCTPSVQSAPAKRDAGTGPPGLLAPGHQRLACSTSSGRRSTPAIRCSSTGPPGNGKTVISQAIHKLLDGDIAIPHALEVEGQHRPALRSGQSRGRGRRTRRGRA